VDIANKKFKQVASQILLHNCINRFGESNETSKLLRQPKTSLTFCLTGLREITFIILGKLHQTCCYQRISCCWFTKPRT